MQEHDAAKSWGRIGGLTAWARNDAETMTGAAHRGFRARFEREVDPDGTLPAAERAARAERARRAYMLTLAAKSAAARRKTIAHKETAEALIETCAPAIELEDHRHDRPAT
jgi:hypothetical protein